MWQLILFTGSAEKKGGWFRRQVQHRGRGSVQVGVGMVGTSGLGREERGPGIVGLDRGD